MAPTTKLVFVVGGHMKTVLQLNPDSNAQYEPDLVQEGKILVCNSKVPTPRVWSIEVRKCSGTPSYNVTVAFDGKSKSTADHAWVPLPNLRVTTVKYSSGNIFLWVINSGGGSATIVLPEEETAFQPYYFKDSVTKAMDVIKKQLGIEGYLKVLPEEFDSILCKYDEIQTVLERFLLRVEKVNAQLAQVAAAHGDVSSNPGTTRTRALHSRDGVVPPAASRDGGVVLPEAPHAEMATNVDCSPTATVVGAGAPSTSEVATTTTSGAPTSGVQPSEMLTSGTPTSGTQTSSHPLSPVSPAKSPTTRRKTTPTRPRREVPEEQQAPRPTAGGKTRAQVASRLSQQKVHAESINRRREKPPGEQVGGRGKRRRQDERSSELGRPPIARRPNRQGRGSGEGTEDEAEVVAGTSTLGSQKRQSTSVNYSKGPSKVPIGKELNVLKANSERQQSEELYSDLFVFGGQRDVKDVHINQMRPPPDNLKLRPFHSSLQDYLRHVFLTEFNLQKQVLTLMPVTSMKPASWEDVKDGNFYLINGQHTYAAVRLLLNSRDVSQERKKELRTWSCNFVWSDRKLELIKLADRINATNGQKWEKQDVVLYLEHARKIWVDAGRPQKKVLGARKIRRGDADVLAWKDFHDRAVAVLNSMSGMDNKKPADAFQGEILIITSEDEVWGPVIRALKLYGEGGLKDPDTGDLYRNATKWSGKKYDIDPLSAYTFKNLRGFGPKALLEVQEKIVGGVAADGSIVPDVFPKVFLGKHSPRKAKGCVSLSEWMERKRWKNIIISEFQRFGLVDNIWEAEDVNSDEWKAWKKSTGFCRPHVDELIRRATSVWLNKKAASRGEPPASFRAELYRCALRQVVKRAELAPMVAQFLDKESKIMPFLQASVHEGTLEESPPPSGRKEYAGAIMDLRYISKLLEDNMPEVDLSSEQWQFENLLEELQAIRMPENIPYWLVIGESKQSRNILQILNQYFPEHKIFQSEYIASSAEKSFYSEAKRSRSGTSTVLFILQPRLDGGLDSPLQWPTRVESDDPRFQKKKTYGEASLRSHSEELRMETYLRFIEEVIRQTRGSDFGANFACILAGRKPIIAALMSGLRPVAITSVKRPHEFYLSVHDWAGGLESYLFDYRYKIDDIFPMPLQAVQGPIHDGEDVGQEGEDGSEEDLVSEDDPSTDDEEHIQPNSNIVQPLQRPSGHQECFVRDEQEHSMEEENFEGWEHSKDASEEHLPPKQCQPPDSRTGEHEEAQHIGEVDIVVVAPPEYPRHCTQAQARSPGLIRTQRNLRRSFQDADTHMSSPRFVLPNLESIGNTVFGNLQGDPSLLHPLQEPTFVPFLQENLDLLQIASSGGEGCIAKEVGSAAYTPSHFILDEERVEQTAPDGVVVPAVGESETEWRLADCSQVNCPGDEVLRLTTEAISDGRMKRPFLPDALDTVGIVKVAKVEPQEFSFEGYLQPGPRSNFRKDNCPQQPLEDVIEIDSDEDCDPRPFPPPLPDLAAENSSEPMESKPTFEEKIDSVLKKMVDRGSITKERQLRREAEANAEAARKKLEEKDEAMARLQQQLNDALKGKEFLTASTTSTSPSLHSAQGHQTTTGSVASGPTPSSAVTGERGVLSEGGAVFSETVIYNTQEELLNRGLKLMEMPTVSLPFNTEDSSSQDFVSKLRMNNDVISSCYSAPNESKPGFMLVAHVQRPGQDLSGFIRFRGGDVQGSKHHLLVLDLNSTLCCIQQPQLQHSNVSKLRLGKRKVIAGYYVFPRPGLQEFLATIFAHFHIIIWSNLVRQVTIEISNHLLGDEFQPIEILSREDCTVIRGHDGKLLSDPICPKNELVFKVLGECVWSRNESLFASTGLLASRANTLLLCANPLEALLNPRYSSIHPNPFVDEGEEPNFMTEVLLAWLMKWRESGLSARSYVRNNPIGQAEQSSTPIASQHVTIDSGFMPSNKRIRHGGSKKSKYAHYVSDSESSVEGCDGSGIVRMERWARSRQGIYGGGPHVDVQKHEISMLVETMSNSSETYRTEESKVATTGSIHVSKRKK